MEGLFPTRIYNVSQMVNFKVTQRPNLCVFLMVNFKFYGHRWHHQPIQMQIKIDLSNRQLFGLLKCIRKAFDKPTIEISIAYTLNNHKSMFANQFTMVEMALLQPVETQAHILSSTVVTSLLSLIGLLWYVTRSRTNFSASSVMIVDTNMRFKIFR